MTQLLNALPGALVQGLIWGVMAIGVYITYKVLDIADLTVDGSICTGAAVCTMLLLGGQSPWLALDHLSLTLRDGDFVTVIGGNGAGKSTLMITHNMRDAIRYGNRLLMLHNGRIVLDISGEEKARLTVPDLLALFSKVSGQEYDNDRALLA